MCDKAEINKPGTAQVGAISKAQKDSKPLFLQLETTKALKKLKIEKIFLKFPVNRIVPKNLKRELFGIF